MPSSVTMLRWCSSFQKIRYICEKQHSMADVILMHVEIIDHQIRPHNKKKNRYQVEPRVYNIRSRKYQNFTSCYFSLFITLLHNGLELKTHFNGFCVNNSDISTILQMKWSHFFTSISLGSLARASSCYIDLSEIFHNRKHNRCSLNN